MKAKFYTLLLIVSTFMSAQAQRYITEVFTDVTVEQPNAYGIQMAINFATGGLDTSALGYQLYHPTGDSLTDRPIVLVSHTGSFLPPVINGQATGQIVDSTVVEVCKQLARRGYVAMAYTYRLGWRADATSDDVRKGTLLQAAYRGIQDSRAAIRFVRRSVAEQGNPFGVDPDKIAMWGIGTGGYMSAGCATLDRHSEVELDKFLDVTLNPYIDSTLLGNIYGNTNKPGCIANHTGYSNDIAFAFNMGGALGDLEWIQDGNSAPMSGVHCLQDAFAPYYVGNVVVPTTGAIVIDNAAGTRGFMEKANALGINDIFDNLTAMQDPLSPYINAFKNVDIMWGPLTIKLGEDNMFPFLRARGESAPWEWWSKTDLDNLVAFINAQTGGTYDSDMIHAQSLLTNMDMSVAKGKAHIDTSMWLAAPRMCLALDLGCFSTSITELSDDEIGLQFGPNPAIDKVVIETASDYPMESIYVYDLNGKLVQADVHKNTNQYVLQRNNLPTGLYMVQIRVKDGYVTKKLAFN